MIQQHGNVETRHLSDPAPLAMIAFSLPLFIWSAFNAGYFDVGTQEGFVIPLAVFFGAPIAFATAMWAYYHRDAYLATLAGLLGAYWASYGMLLWLTQRGVVADSTTTGDIRGLFFAAWAVSLGIVWLGSMRQHWTLGLVALGATVMFGLLAVGYYGDTQNLIKAGGWAGFVTAALGWYAALAEMLNAEFERNVLPTEPGWFLHLGSRAH